FDPLGPDRLPPASEVPRLAELVWRLRPLAKMAVNAEVARALERSATRFLGERLAHVLQHLHEESRRG
ncbi:MAG: MerR family transcriptional regulator, partial [Candidatus Binatia bacterium]